MTLSDCRKNLMEVISASVVFPLLCQLLPIGYPLWQRAASFVFSGTGNRFGAGRRSNRPHRLLPHDGRNERSSGVFEGNGKRRSDAHDKDVEMAGNLYERIQMLFAPPDSIAFPLTQTRGGLIKKPLKINGFKWRP